MAQPQDLLKELLVDRSADELRAMCIKALRTWWKSGRHDGLQFSMHSDLGRPLVVELAAMNHRTMSLEEARPLAEHIIQSQHLGWMRDINEAVWSLVQAGYFIPLGTSNNSFPITLRLTRRGQRFLERDDDHPLLPGYLDRLQNLSPKVPDAIIGMFADARACLERSLLRPAVIVLGVAYEVAIEDVVDNLATKNLVPSKTRSLKASEKIVALKQAVASQPFQTFLTVTEERTAALAAVDYADDLRAERNKGAHTATEFDSNGTVEEFIVSGGRHFPALWRMARV